MSDEAVAFLTRLVTERHSSVQSASQALIRTLAGNDAEAKHREAAKLLAAIEALQAVLAKRYQPDWLREMESQARNLAEKRWKPDDFLLNYLTVQPALASHRWAFEAAGEGEIDFEAIFQRYRAEGRLPQLLEQIVSLLVQLRESGCIDSVSMLRTLDRVISSLKKGQSGTFLSLRGAWAFLMNFVQNYLWMELAELPVLGTAVSALKKTIEEADVEMANLSEQMQAEFTREGLGADLPGLTYTSAGTLSLPRAQRMLPYTKA